MRGFGVRNPASSREALTHRDILGVIEETCTPCRKRARWRSFRAAGESKGS